jgi:hypothetical protein
MDSFLQLPKESFVNKFIPKNIFFKKAAVNSKLKQEFADSIAKITWNYKLSPETIHISKTDTVEEIEVFTLELKQQEIPKNILRIIDKSIPYPILYIFVYNDQNAYGISLKVNTEQRYYFSSWNKKMNFAFMGNDLEQVYQKIVTQFIDINTDEKDFETIIAIDKKRTVLQREIDSLKNKINNEKQFNKQVSLNKELQVKLSEINALQ